MVSPQLASYQIVSFCANTEAEKIKIDYDIINLDLPLFAASTVGLIAMIA
jgi:hypothetical protein